MGSDSGHYSKGNEMYNSKGYSSKHSKGNGDMFNSKHSKLGDMFESDYDEKFKKSMQYGSFYGEYQ